MLDKTFYLVNFEVDGEMHTQMDLKWSFKEALDEASALTTRLSPVDKAWVVEAKVFETGKVFATIVRPKKKEEK